MTRITPKIINQILALQADGRNVDASDLGLDRGEIVDDLQRRNAALHCLHIQALEAHGTEETYIYWGSTQMPDGVAVWSVDTTEGLLCVEEGRFPSLDAARAMAEADAQKIWAALK